MPRFVVLLRGVNVGKGNRVPMADFKRMLEGLGYRDVRTVLNSGNAVVTGPGRSSHKHAQAISAALQQAFGFAVPVVVRSASEFSAVVRRSPVIPPKEHHSRFLVAFGQDKAALSTLAPLMPLASGPERFVVTDDAAYLSCPDGLLKSKVGAAILGKAGKAVTTRNWATLLKIEALLGAD